jgi:hypothetical protein
VLSRLAGIGRLAGPDLGKRASGAHDGIGGFLRGRDPHDVFGHLGRLVGGHLADVHDARLDLLQIGVLPRRHLLGSLVVEGLVAVGVEDGAVPFVLGDRLAVGCEPFLRGDALLRFGVVEVSSGELGLGAVGGGAGGSGVGEERGANASASAASRCNRVRSSGSAVAAASAARKTAVCRWVPAASRVPASSLAT